jgi:hypothetical protein
VTITHDKSIKLDFLINNYLEVWKKAANIILKLYKEYHEKLIEHIKESQFPFYVFKYEDLV